MALIPKISVEFNVENKSFVVKDVTGLFHHETNPGGYGIATVDRPAVINAHVLVQYNKNYQVDIDVTSAIRSSSDEEILLFEHIKGTSLEDGIYRFYLFIESDVGEQISMPAQLFIDEKVRYHASNFWAKLACNYDIYDKRPLETECIWIESNLGILQSLKNRSKESEYLNLLGFITKRIDVNLSLIK